MTTIRPATSEDARGIATIHVEAWQAAYRDIVPDEFLDSLSIDGRESAWRERLSAGDAMTWVAQRTDTIVGWISAAACRDADAPASAGEIWAVYVTPPHWGKGVGRLLCNTAERHLLSAGFAEVTLWVLRDNQPAVKFYQSNGFVPDEGSEKILKLGGKSLSEVRFRKPLSAAPAADNVLPLGTSG